MAGRHDGDHSSLMWCLRLERRVCPHLGEQGGLPTHPNPDSALSGFEAVLPPARAPDPHLAGIAVLHCILPSEFCKTPNAAAEAQSRTHGSPCKRASSVL